MRKIVAAINMTIDGVCDHMVLMPGEDIHDHYTALLNGADAILYGRITYQLMEYWRPFKEKPSGERSMDEFATAIDRIPKIVFSHTLKNTGWDSAELSDQTVEEMILELKRSGNDGSRDILIGSRSLIIQLMKLGLIDEFQFCIHPMVAGEGMQLFEEAKERTLFKLLNTKIFDSGAILLYYGRS